MKALVTELKDLNQDFEWYPTTQRMIDCIKRDMIKYFHSDYNYKTEESGNFLSAVSVLDCGAGDGRVVKQLSNGGSMYGIEKSQRLIKQMPADLFIVGTEFFQSTLIDKEVQVIFCNPPYSEYVQWAEKIILEANAKMLYLIIPKRWQGVESIVEALETRKAKWNIISTDNFLDAERAARATVDIISIRLFDDSRYNNNTHPKTDPFDIWFDENFKLNADREKPSKLKSEQAKTFKEEIENQLTANNGLVPVLVSLYNQEMDHLQNMFLAICKLDGDILKELDVSVNNIKEALKQRITGLKIKYWHELFDNYEKITKRLTHGSRKAMLDKLTSHTSIDFTESNCYAVTIWVIKNANNYYDSQLIDLVEKMIDKANVKLYKSNKRLYEDQDWRSSYGSRRQPKDLNHFGLELRIVLHSVGGLHDGGWNSYDYPNNLNKRSHKLLDDVTTIANNLGFQLPSFENSKSMGDWESNKKKDFYQNKMQGKLLMTVKAFKNGNMHIKFSQDFIRTLNVEFGRLKGWLTNHVQASEELNIPIKKTEKLFKANYQLTQTNGLLQIGLN